jgi:serine protease Do
MPPHRAPLWTAAVIGLLLGLLAGSAWLLLRGRAAVTQPAIGHETASSLAAPAVLPATAGGGSTAEDESAAGDSVQEQISGRRRTAIVRATQKVAPAVVSINVIQHQTYALRSPSLDFWERFMPGQIPRREFQRDVQSLGSGVIVSADGYVLTNYHVVEGADEIILTLSDGRQYPGRLLETVERYDLALLQVDAQDLPVATLASSVDLQIGEWAIAIGSPFGYLLADTQPTVTVGVISALNRDIKSSSQSSRQYLGMIQTDAAINPGNSGGPLVDADGEVVGINTFIFTESGGSIGIGFAVPSERAQWLIDEVREYGRYRAPYSGLGFQQLSGSLVRAFGLKDPVGFVVLEVDEGSPAAKAGLRIGDIIRSINDVPLRTRDTVTRLIYEAKVGTHLHYVAERDGERLEGDIVLEELPRRER